MKLRDYFNRMDSTKCIWDCYNYNQIFISNDFLYIRIERAASKFITSQIIQDNVSREPNSEVAVTEYCNLNNSLVIKEVFFISEKPKKLPKCLVVVRNPYERFLSILDLTLSDNANFANTDKTLFKFFSKINTLTNDIELIVDKFINYFYAIYKIEFPNWPISDEYNIFLPQSKVICNCDIEILKVEEFESRWKDVFGVEYPKEDVLNVKERNYLDGYKLTETQKIKLREIYDIDFRNFGYE